MYLRGVEWTDAAEFVLTTYWETLEPEDYVTHFEVVEGLDFGERL